MPTSERISKYRDRLDKTLASPNLTNAETLKTLLKNHLQQSSLDETEVFAEELLNRRTEEVLNFIDMLRSASVNNHVSKASQTTNKEWKLKQDNEEFRVMYREGPEGTPFHTLLVEGYIDGPMDRCLCVSWESALYKKWWPQYTVPAFKITSSQCLHKIRIGENISSVRVKVSWPLSSREAIVHCFEFEYLQDDLIIIILNSISETEEIDKSTHGYSRDMIPEAKDVIRIGVVGGFAMQKVTPERSYFRTIANMDLKLDFVPPSLINFISRQLIGSGFRLYQKAVASVFNSDEEFKKALGDSLYTRIREGFYSKNQENGSLEYDKIENKKSILMEEEIVKVEEDVIKDRSQDTQTDEGVEEVLPNGIPPQDRHSCGEIEEVKNEDINEESSNHILNPTEGMVAENSCSNGKRKVYVSPEVEEALGTLEKVISMFRQYGLNVDSRPSFSDDESQGLVTGPMEGTISENGGVNIKDDNIAKASKKETMENPTEDPRLSSGTHSMRGRKSSSSGTRDVHHNKVAPAFPEERLVVPDQINHITVHTLDSSATHNTKDLTTQTDFATESDLGSETKLSRRWIKHRLCCFHPVFQH